MKDEISIYEEYFEYVQKYTEIHGPKTVVCMQVGSFYEIYGLKYPNSDVITGSLISEISDITGLSVVSKKYTYLGAVVYMSGFRDLYHTFDKYLQIMMEHGYIVVEIVQDPDDPDNSIHKKKKKTHSFKAVHSAGTYLSYETDARPTLTNHMMSIWMEQNCKKKRLIYGVSVLNIYTGESAIFEHEMADWMNPTMFDELERYVAMYAPSEVIFLHDFLDSDSDSKVKKILQYIKLPSNSVVHLLSISEKGKPEKQQGDRQREILSNCTKQKYIEYVLDKYFGEDTFQVCSEFAYYMYATQSLCYLLHFLEEHNQCFTQRLSLPTFQNTSKRVVLANHTLKQLNILSDNNHILQDKGTFGSILSLLNKCQTAMGKRKFQTQLLQPVFDEKWLNQEYEMTDFFRSGSEDLLENFRKGLAKVKDLEKIGRQIIAKKIYPSSIYDLHQSLSILQQLQVCLAEEKKSILEYLSVDESDLSNLLKFLETNIRIDSCQNQTSGSGSSDIIAKGISKEIDEYQNRLAFLQNSLLGIREYLGKYVILKKKEKDADTDANEGPIKISESDKNGYVLITTKARGDAMIALLSNKEEHVVPIMNHDTKNKNNTEIRFTRKEIRISNLNKTTSEIHFPQLDAITEEMDNIREILQEKTKYYFLQFLDQFIDKKYDSLVLAIRFASTLDVILCKAYIAKKYRYCRPTLVSRTARNEKSFVDARDIRHALIEHINQKEIYVTNDLILNANANEVAVAGAVESMNGMVLFGTNAVGKTSLIRALGIAVIMAQAGIYVPCSEFRYRPYTAIFSRILSNDNLFKGLSTFAVEISELGVILKNADQNSLILGDELCSGTETDSALAIFMTTLEHLHTKQSTFLFATHFHEILEFEEMESLDKIGIYHLAVTYDREKDCLIYDRKLKEGEGSRTYGLEVCKSLYLPTAFLERAYELRRQLSPENDGILSHVSSKYNAKKIRGFCENCNVRLGEEIHHIKEQREANRENGYFEGENGIHWIHKNHPANLMSVCSKCHDLFHSETESGNISPITVSTFYPKPETEIETKIKKTRIRKKTTNGYTLL